MKNAAIFVLYFFLGVFLIFSFRKVNEILNSQQLKTPLASSTFSLNDAPSESLRGTITSLSGEVDWQSRTATEPAKISKPIQIQQGEGIMTKDTGTATVFLSKTANITISPNTELNFIQTLPANILIAQNSGISEYRKLDDNPLSVRTHDLLVKINRGDVVISVTEDEPYIIVDVKSGSITAGYNDIDYVTQVLDVESDNRLIFRTDAKSARILPLQ